MKAHFKALTSVLIVLTAGFGMWAFWTKKTQGRAAQEASRGLETLPQFQVEDLNGQKISSEDFKGKVLIVNFWASWCAPCVEEIPSFVRIKKIMGDRLNILAISNDNSKEDIDIFLKSFPEFRGDGIQIVQDTPKDFPITKMFGVFRLPESFVFNQNGKMIRKVVGTIDWSSKDAQDYLMNIKESE